MVVELAVFQGLLFRVNNTEKIRILIEYSPIYIRPAELNVPDTFEAIVNSEFLVIKFKTNEGAGDFELFEKPNRLKIKGAYLGSLDTLKKYVKPIDPFTFKERIEVMKYFEPIKHGKWIYYNKDGDIIKLENYDKGILQY